MSACGYPKNPLQLQGAAQLPLQSPLPALPPCAAHPWSRIRLETGRPRSFQTLKLLLTTSLAFSHSFQDRQLRSRSLLRLLIPKKSCGKAGTVRDREETAKSIPTAPYSSFTNVTNPTFPARTRRKAEPGRAGIAAKRLERGKLEEKPDSRSERPFPLPPRAHSSQERSRAPAGRSEGLG